MKPVSLRAAAPEGVGSSTVAARDLTGEEAMLRTS